VLRAVTTVQSFVVARHPDGQRGQATAEYALVLLGAATIALLLLAWATKSGRIGKLFDLVFDALADKL
jgi:hypothetical protein